MTSANDATPGAPMLTKPVSLTSLLASAPEQGPPWDEGVCWLQPERLTQADRGVREKELLTTPQEAPRGYEVVYAVSPEPPPTSWLAGRHPLLSGDLEEIVGWWGEADAEWWVRLGLAPKGWADGLQEFLGW